MVADDLTKPTLIGTDASDLGLGFWRGQPQDPFVHVPPTDLTMDQIKVV